MTRRSLIHSAAIAPVLAQRSDALLAGKLRTALSVLPLYGCFDYLTVKLDGGKLVLGGYAARPTLKDDAGRALEALGKIDNQIEVLPPSAADDEVRWALFRGIYRDPALARYAPGGPYFGGPYDCGAGSLSFASSGEHWSATADSVQALGAYPVHMIVKNGHAVLLGVAMNKDDSARANLLANAVPGVASVKNLIVADAQQMDAPGEVWTFDRLDRIGGHPTQAFGTPRVIATSKGKAVEFDGVEDALFIDNHPLAGARVFTWEVIFRPAKGGRPEQRFFHMAENGSTNRYLMETRLIGDQWCLDTFAATTSGQQTLIDRKLLHPLDAWHHCALVYDGTEMRHYVNGKLELKANVSLAPHGTGQTSVGVRFNKVDYFRGAIRMARMTRRVLAPAEFLKV